jgi:hypothetical protein
MRSTGYLPDVVPAKSGLSSDIRLSYLGGPTLQHFSHAFSKSSYCPPVFRLRSGSFAQNPEFNPLRYVNPFTGTGGHGHTYPGATAPYGMVPL